MTKWVVPLDRIADVKGEPTTCEPCDHLEIARRAEVALDHRESGRLYIGSLTNSCREVPWFVRHIIIAKGVALFNTTPSRSRSCAGATAVSRLSVEKVGVIEYL